MRKRPAFTLMELLVVLVIITLLIALLLPALGRARDAADQTKSSAHLRGQHAGMVIFSQDNNSYLPGIGRDGRIYQDNFGDPLTTVDSSLPSSRMWLLLNGVFFAGEMAINPHDAKARWDSGRVTVDNFSYAMLQISDTTASGRLAEWRASGNSLAAIVSDRALIANVDAGAAGAPDATIRSVWSTIDGSWVGSVVWADNHVDLYKSHRDFETRYLATLNTADNLFADGEGIPFGATEPGGVAGGQAFMVYE
jgi:prepilin-type N-terminal cleavage/methylation domain-containing protein